MFFRQHEKHVEEIDALLGLENPITASGAVMALPAAVADLSDWIADRRKYLPVQFGDWAQVVDDYRESMRATGPKLRAFLKPVTAQVELLLQSLLDSQTESIDAASRSSLAHHLEALTNALLTPDATVAAWRDLVAAAESGSWTHEQICHRRDILWAIVYRRDLDLGPFGTLRQVRHVLNDNDDDGHRELAEENGVEHNTRFRPALTPQECLRGNASSSVSGFWPATKCGAIASYG